MVGNDKPGDAKKTDTPPTPTGKPAEGAAAGNKLANQSLGLPQQGKDQTDPTEQKAAATNQKESAQKQMESQVRDGNQQQGSAALHKEVQSTWANRQPEPQQLVPQQQEKLKQDKNGADSLATPSPYESASQDAKNEASSSAGGHITYRECSDKQGHKTFTTVQDGRITHHTDDGTAEGTTFNITARGIDAHLGNGAHFKRDFNTNNLTYDVAESNVHFKQLFNPDLRSNADCSLDVAGEHYLRRNSVLYKFVPDSGVSEVKDNTKDSVAAKDNAKDSPSSKGISDRLPMPDDHVFHLSAVANNKNDIQPIPGHWERLSDEQQAKGIVTHGITLTATLTKFADGTVIESNGEATLYTGDKSHRDNSMNFADGYHASARGVVTDNHGNEVGSAHFGTPGAATYGPEAARAMEDNAILAALYGGSEDSFAACEANLWSLIISSHSPEVQNSLMARLCMLLAVKDAFMANAQEKKQQEEAKQTRLA
jgi:hypothetical protein